MRNSAYLCIMVLIHMDACNYTCFFSNFEYFLVPFFSSSGPVRIFGVDWSGSDNIICTRRLEGYGQLPDSVI
jgi:hypothetical protein